MSVRFAVKESFSCGKHPPKNDDALALTPHFTAVIDGVTGPQGTAAAQCVQNVLEGLNADATEREFAREIAAVMEGHFGPPLPTTRMAAATAAIYSHARHEVWLYGDAIAAVIDLHGHVTRHTATQEWETPLFHTRKALNTMMLLSGELASPDDLYRTDPGREHLQAWGLRQHNFANRKDTCGYTVLCARPVPHDMAKVMKLPADTANIALLTDGYPVHLMESLQLFSFKELEEALAEINREDPHCMGLNLGLKGIMDDPVTGKRGESYDDRSVVILERVE